MGRGPRPVALRQVATNAQIPHRMNIAPANLAAIRTAYRDGAATGDFMPAVYVVKPTSECALNCVMCPQSSLPAAKLGEMPIARAEQIAETISPYAELVMLYFMGEPLQHSDFGGFLAAMRRRIKGRLVLSTNAMALDGPRLDAVIAHGIDLVIACVDRFEKHA